MVFDKRWLGGAVVRASRVQIPAAALSRVQHWTSCSHTLSIASGVTTLIMALFKNKTKKISAREWQKFLTAAD